MRPGVAVKAGFTVDDSQGGQIPFLQKYADVPVDCGHGDARKLCLELVINPARPRMGPGRPDQCEHSVPLFTVPPCSYHKSIIILISKKVKGFSYFFEKFLKKISKHPIV
jgi:hypothetical protein